MRGNWWMLPMLFFLLTVPSTHEVEGRVHVPKRSRNNRNRFRRNSHFVKNANNNNVFRRLQPQTLDDPYIPQKAMGDGACPCLTGDDLATYSTTPDSLDNSSNTLGDLNIDLPTNYGIGCESHYLKTDPACQNIDECTSIIPLPAECDRSWCLRSWCYVDTDTCQVQYTQSPHYLGVSTSFATCGHLDPVTYNDRTSALENRTLMVALNHNTGGWMGAYHPSETSFATDNAWYGPLVVFLENAARAGGFQLQITGPPEWLGSEAANLFGNSSFDFCVYATALGYLDLCVADYTITSSRASITPFFELQSEPVYLVVFTGDEEDGLKDFINHFVTIFQPFSLGTWLLIAFFILPLLGLIMLYHEHDVSGSAFSKDFQVRVVNKETGNISVETRPVAMHRRVAKAVYLSYLGLCHGTYDVAVLSVGGKIHLLSILAFLVLILAVYTANLAAILTASLQTNEVDSLEEAVGLGYSFCASRQVANMISEVYDLDPEKYIVPDPISEGGDGQPGFNCPDCLSRTRVLDFMKQNHDDPTLFCNAALATQEDLSVMQQYGSHCNKTIAGDILSIISQGIPIRRDIAPDLTAWLYDQKFKGHLAEIFVEEAPESQCASEDSEVDSRIGLTIAQLSGIWMIVFFFVIAGFAAKIIRNIFYQKFNHRHHKAVLRDQWGNPWDNPKTPRIPNEDKSKHPVETQANKFSVGDKCNNGEEPVPIVRLHNQLVDNMVGEEEETAEDQSNIRRTH